VYEVGINKRIIIQYSCVLTFKRLLFNFVILTNTMGMLHLNVTASYSCFAHTAKIKLTRNTNDQSSVNIVIVNYHLQESQLFVLNNPISFYLTDFLSHVVIIKNKKKNPRTVLREAHPPMFTCPTISSHLRYLLSDSVIWQHKTPSRWINDMMNDVWLHMWVL
jgi:hypothetical protein